MGKEKKELRKEAQMERDNQSTLPKWVDGKHLPYVAAGIAVVFLCSALYSLTSMATKIGDLRYVELTSQSEVKEILFSGNPYVVICNFARGNAFRAQERQAQEELRGEIQWVSMDCDKKLPSGKTVPERVKLSNELPQGFVSTGDRYWQFSKETSNPEKLVEYIRHSMKPRAIEVAKPVDFKKKCADAAACVIIAYHHKLNTTIRETVLAQHAKFRQIRTVAINAQKHQLMLDDAFRALRPKGHSEHWVTVLGIATPTAGIVHGQFLQDVSSDVQMAELFSTLDRAPTKLSKLAQTPLLLAREKKLAKRKSAETEEAQSEHVAEAEDEDGDDFTITWNDAKASQKDEL